MSLLTIDGYALKKFFISGANYLSFKKNYVDSLNVFPVPDGDTGTNMSLTALSAAAEAEKINTPNIYDVAKAASNGSLRGARGNSGVILSQLYRGFAKGLEGKEVASADDIAYALVTGMETAYKAVMKPKEGTILTIARALCERAAEASYKSDDIRFLMSDIIEYSNKILEQTPDMLPQLKKAGVVDAGGQGLIYIVEGGFNGIKNNISEPSILLNINKSNAEVFPKGIEDADIKYGYCTEFFINLSDKSPKHESDLKNYLQTQGDSIVVVSDDDIIKVHVHTDHPGKVLERALNVGEIENIKIENMRIQHTNRINFSEENNDNEELKKYAFISVSSGSGLKQIFKDLGADAVIEGGQTMNPSTEDFIGTAESLNAENIFILPNNKNIILAAEQAANMYKDKNIIVIPSLSIPEGISALINFVPDSSLKENTESMNSALKSVVTGLVTFAVRATEVDGNKISEGDYICIIGSEIVCSGTNLKAVSEKLIDLVISKNTDCSFISVYYGEDIAPDDAECLAGYINDKYSDLDTEVHYGGQPLYYYIISAE